MAYGNEVWLGYHYSDYCKHAPTSAPRILTGEAFAEYIAKREDIDQADVDTDNTEEALSIFRDQFETYANTHSKELLVAWREAVKELGWGPFKAQTDSIRPVKYYIGKTPAGKREFSPFSLSLECGGEMMYAPPTMPIGVPLSSRYTPTYLDYEDVNGTLPCPLTIWTPENGSHDQDSYRQNWQSHSMAQTC